ncbi:MAG TPA: hypothetical protein VMA77_17605 [Solirubrobacteraceae bacterium]|nr:hypothetical protein [Solirubrobacteraceae bacterium]
MTVWGGLLPSVCRASSRELRRHPSWGHAPAVAAAWPAREHGIEREVPEIAAAPASA